MKYTYENTSKIGKHYLVFLDGIQLEACVECDTDKGYAIVYLLDEASKLVVGPDGEAATARLEGVVTVEPI